MTPPVSPDCAAAKHTACTGDAMDDHDRIVQCMCACHGASKMARHIASALFGPGGRFAR